MRVLVRVLSFATALATGFSASPAGAFRIPVFQGNANVHNRAGALIRDATPGHLFVVDNSGNGVLYRFPLGKDGLPNATPDGQVNVGFGASSVAMGPGGEAYVANDDAHIVEVFAANFVSGAQPERVLNIAGFPSGVAIDALDRLSVVVYNSSGIVTVLGYAPGAAGTVSPLWTTHFPRFTEITAIATDEQDRLVLQLVEDNILITPYPFSAIAPLQIISNVPSQGTESGVTLAAGELYFTTEVGWGRGRDVIAVGAVPATASGHVNADRIIYADDCHGKVFSGFDPISYGIAVRGEWLFVGCLAGMPTTANGVQVYYALKGGHQKAHFILQGRELNSVAGIALGP